MARSKATTVAKTSETSVDAKVVLGDELVEVRWHDGSTHTFDFLHGGRTIKFVEGAAFVAPDVALALRKDGYVE